MGYRSAPKAFLPTVYSSSPLSLCHCLPVSLVTSNFSDFQVLPYGRGLWRGKTLQSPNTHWLLSESADIELKQQATASAWHPLMELRAASPRCQCVCKPHLSSARRVKPGSCQLSMSSGHGIALKQALTAVPKLKRNWPGQIIWCFLRFCLLFLGIAFFS